MSAATDPSDIPGLSVERINLLRDDHEMRQFYAEQQKFAAEQFKLLAETAKLQRDTHLAPWIVGGAVAGGILTATTLLLRALGVLS